MRPAPPLTLLAVGAAAAVGVALAGCAGQPSERAAVPAARSSPGLPLPAGAQAARVVEVVDGDTLHLIGEGDGPLPVDRESKVRLIGVDAPEVGERAECFGQQASARLAQLAAPGAEVRVSADRERRDAYGRVLLYLWDEHGELVNLELVRDGAAEALLVRPNDRYIAELRAAEADARRARRGQWAAACH